MSNPLFRDLGPVRALSLLCNGTRFSMLIFPGEPVDSWVLLPSDGTSVGEFLLRLSAPSPTPSSETGVGDIGKPSASADSTPTGKFLLTQRVIEACEPQYGAYEKFAEKLLGLSSSDALAPTPTMLIESATMPPDERSGPKAVSGGGTPTGPVSCS